MKRFSAVILLATYGLVSILGHGGLNVVGLHSHHHSSCNDSSASTHGHGHSHCHSCSHDHIHHSLTDLNNKQPTPEHDRLEPVDPVTQLDGCVVCQFLANCQDFEVVLPLTDSLPLIQPCVITEQCTTTAHESVLPSPRGPPSSLA